MKRGFVESLSVTEREILFEALFLAIECNSGIGFRAGDQGHSDYRDGAAGCTPPDGADNAQTNYLFKMVRELSLHLDDELPALIYQRFGITTWQQFCQMAVSASDKIPKPAYVPLHLRPR